MADMTQATATERAARIAAIHALADWLVDHPDVPIPESVVCGATITRDDEIDEATRAAAVISFARDFPGARLSEHPDHSVDAYVTVLEQHGIRITYFRTAQLEHAATLGRRYVR